MQTNTAVTSAAAEQNAAASADSTAAAPRKKGIKIVLVLLLFLFVAAGITAIAVFMTVILPPMYRQQAYETYAPVLQTAKRGDEIRFGEYEQDNNLLNGGESVEWIVLDKVDNHFLLVSKYALDCVRYNSVDAYVTWDYSSLLPWLNDSFYNTAFSEAEKTMILYSNVDADPNPFFSTDPGEGTNNKVFILSIEEAYQYFFSEVDRMCKPTPYTVAQGVRVDKSNGNCNWWLRSPGYDASVASRVMADGNVSYCGYHVHSNQNAVRPAIWITADPNETVKR